MSDDSVPHADGNGETSPAPAPAPDQPQEETTAPEPSPDKEELAVQEAKAEEDAEASKIEEQLAQKAKAKAEAEERAAALAKKIYDAACKIQASVNKWLYRLHSTKAAISIQSMYRMHSCQNCLLRLSALKLEEARKMASELQTMLARLRRKEDAAITIQHAFHRWFGLKIEAISKEAASKNMSARTLQRCWKSFRRQKCINNMVLHIKKRARRKSLCDKQNVHGHRRQKYAGWRRTGVNCLIGCVGLSSSEARRCDLLQFQMAGYTSSRSHFRRHWRQRLRNFVVDNREDDAKKIVHKAIHVLTRKAPNTDAGAVLCALAEVNSPNRIQECLELSLQASFQDEVRLVRSVVDLGSYLKELGWAMDPKLSPRRVKIRRLHRSAKFRHKSGDRIRSSNVVHPSRLPAQKRALIGAMGRIYVRQYQQRRDVIAGVPRLRQWTSGSEVLMLRHEISGVNNLSSSMPYKGSGHRRNTGERDGDSDEDTTGPFCSEDYKGHSPLPASRHNLYTSLLHEMVGRDLLPSVRPSTADPMQQIYEKKKKTRAHRNNNSIIPEGTALRKMRPKCRSPLSCTLEKQPRGHRARHSSGFSDEGIPLPKMQTWKHSPSSAGTGKQPQGLSLPISAPTSDSTRQEYSPVQRKQSPKQRKQRKRPTSPMRRLRARLDTHPRKVELHASYDWTSRASMQTQTQPTLHARPSRRKRSPARKSKSHFAPAPVVLV